MPKFLALISYTSEGIKGVTKAGGTARRAVADKLLKSLGGRLEAFYFAFGESDAYLIFDVPDNSTAAAISLTVAGTGMIRMKTILLLTPEEIDQAMKKPVHYEPPGWEAQEVAKDIDRLIGEGGKN
jgi:uncharacterized protein with GYD domain